MKDSAHLVGFGRLATILIALKLKPSIAFRFERHVDKLIRSRGRKGALDWLDSLGNLVSNRVFKTQLQLKVWIRKDYYLMFKRSGASNIVLMQRLTKIKRCVTVRQITASQAEKFKLATERAVPSDASLSKAISYVEVGVETLRQYYPKNHNWISPSCLVSYFKREKSRGKPTHEAYSKSLVKLKRDLSSLKANGILPNRHIKQALYPLNLDEVSRLADTYPYVEVEEAPVGTVNCTQEPGMKARFFASPRLVYQKALLPLQTWLMQVLHKVPEDGCFNALGAISRIQGHLKDGQIVYCFDLTSATDTFPAILTWCCLRYSRAVPREILDLLIHVSEGLWANSEEMRKSKFFKDFTLWYVGQPLGTGPSFGAFSKTHHSLVRGIALSLNRPVDCYVMIGDDLAIFDEHVALAYRELQNSLGVIISEEKSVISNRIAEFGGATITRHSHFNPGKWRIISDESLMTFITEPSFDHERVTPRLWNRLIRRMMETPYPFGLLRPDLTDMDEDSLRKLSYCIQALLYKKALTPEADQDAPDLCSDNTILLELARHDELVLSLFPPLVEGHRHHFRPEKQMLEVRFRNAMHNEDGYKDYFPRSASPCSLYMRQESVFSTLSEPPEDRGLPFLDKAVTISDLESCYEASSFLDDNVAACFEACAGLVHSIIMSARLVAITPVMWVDAVPVLRKHFACTVTEPDHLDLVQAAITNLPYFHVEDLEPARSRFVAVLRRYSTPTEVLPPLRTPLPRFKRG